MSLAAGLSACGPVEYVREVNGNAATAVERAKEANAEQAAPYEYTAAVQYLKKAREEGSYSEYQTAVEYGRRAAELARRARAIAERAKQDEAQPSAPARPSGSSP